MTCFDAGRFSPCSYPGFTPNIESEASAIDTHSVTLNPGVVGSNPTGPSSTHLSLMRHDVFTKSATRRGGGEGFTLIPSFVVPTLRHSGVSDDDLKRITVANPAQLLTF